MTSNYTGPSSSPGAFCDDATPCTFDIRLPINGSYSAAKGTPVCVRLDNTDASGTSLTATTTFVSLADLSPSNGVLTATCRASRQGMYMVLQRDAQDGATPSPPVTPSPSPSLGANPSDASPSPVTSTRPPASYSAAAVVGEAPVSFTYIFAMDFTALNASASAMANFKRELQVGVGAVDAGFGHCKLPV